MNLAAAAAVAAAVPVPGPDLRLLADDLTGALDSAAAFAVAGGVPVYLDAAPGEPGVGVAAVMTPTRDVDSATLAQHLAGVSDWFCGAAIAFKKVDSLLRGNTVAECAWLARAGGFDGIVFAPAFPQQRRVTRGGRQFVLPAAGAGEPAAVGRPIAEAFAALGLTRCVSGKLGSVALAAAIEAAGEAAGKVACGIAAPLLWIPDVDSAAELERIARLAVTVPSALPRRWLWCGSAGLAHALAQCCGLASDAAADADADANADAGRHLAPHDADATASPGTGGGVLLLGASRHAVTRAQWARLRVERPAALQVFEGDAAQFAAALRALQQGVDLAALDLAPRHDLTPQAAAALLRQQIQALVQHAPPPRLLLVVGGDTLLAICRAAGVASLRSLPARRLGWGCARLVGGRWDGVVCHARSGAFGDEHDLHTRLSELCPPRLVPAT